MNSRGTAWIIGVSIVGLTACVGFAVRRKDQSRVHEARSDKEAIVRGLVKNAGLAYPPKSLYLRAFKTERQLEIWGANATSESHKLIKTYQIVAMSGEVGPKRREGDRQVPEGFYTIDRFNPRSSYYLSLGINYPNASDRILSDKEHPGGDIFIHGNAVSIGCLAMTDDKIKEIYVLALDARDAGAKNIPVHIFPSRMDDKTYATLRRDHPNRWLPTLWEPLRAAYSQFERTHKVPATGVNRDGTYSLMP